MRLRRMFLSVGLASLTLSSIAETPLLIDPAKAPITLKGGWRAKRPAGGVANGDMAVRISKIGADGSFEGKLDFLGPISYCKANDEPITEGRVLKDGLRVVANGGPRTICGTMTLEFHRGKEKFLVGKVQSEAGSGAHMWLNAPE